MQFADQSHKLLLTNQLCCKCSQFYLELHRLLFLVSPHSFATSACVKLMVFLFLLLLLLLFCCKGGHRLRTCTDFKLLLALHMVWKPGCLSSKLFVTASANFSQQHVFELDTIPPAVDHSFTFNIFQCQSFHEFNLIFGPFRNSAEA